MIQTNAHYSNKLLKININSLFSPLLQKSFGLEIAYTPPPISETADNTNNEKSLFSNIFFNSPGKTPFTFWNGFFIN